MAILKAGLTLPAGQKRKLMIAALNAWPTLSQMALRGFRVIGRKSDANRPPSAPDDFAAPADESLRNGRKPERGSNRRSDACHKLRAISGYIQNLAFVALDAAVERDPCLVLAHPAK